MNKPKKPRTYDGEILSVLIYEFSDSEHAKNDKKIKRRLREKKLGPYDQARVDLLRSFKDDAQDELHKRDESKFFAGHHGEYSAMEDWDFDKLLGHLHKKHPKLPKKEINGFLSFAIYNYYLR